MVEAIRRGATEVDNAECLIFSPATMRILRELEVSEELIDLVHLGTELEDVRELVPNAFVKSLDDISTRAISFLKTKDELKLRQPSWLMRKLTNSGDGLGTGCGSTF